MTLKTDNAIIGVSATDSQNFFLDTDLAGGLRLRRNSNGSGQTILSVSSAGQVSTPATQGSIIQMQAYPQDAGSTTTNSTFTNMNVSSKIFTPRSANSTIIVECVFQAYTANVASQNMAALFQLHENTVGLLGGAIQMYPLSGSGGIGMYASQVVKFHFTNTTLAQKFFNLRGAVGGAGGTAYANNQIWTITEVQN